MKKIFTIIIILIIGVASAQTPQKMSYQAVLRNAMGNLLVQTNVGMRISILQGNVNGTVTYQETYTTMTNANGLVSIEIGGGNPVSGSFASIDWQNGPYFIKTESDPNGGTNYSIVGTSQLLSVPYAMYAENSRHQGKTSIYFTGNITDAQAAAKIAAELGPNTENIVIYDTTQLTTLDLSAITTLVSLRMWVNPALTSINLNGLTMVYESLNISGTYTLPTLSMPNLVYANNVDINGNSLLTVLSMPSLTTTGATLLYIIGNQSLSNINIPAFANLRGGILNFGSNALPVAKINSLLNQFLTVDSPSTMEITLNNQNPLAPPSGQGIIDKQTLIDNGNSVFTD